MALLLKDPAKPYRGSEEKLGKVNWLRKSSDSKWIRNSRIVLDLPGLNAKSSLAYRSPSGSSGS